MSEQLTCLGEWLLQSLPLSLLLQARRWLSALHAHPHWVRRVLRSAGMILCCRPDCADLLKRRQLSHSCACQLWLRQLAQGFVRLMTLEQCLQPFPAMGWGQVEANPAESLLAAVHSLAAHPLRLAWPHHHLAASLLLPSCKAAQGLCSAGLRSLDPHHHHHCDPAWLADLKIRRHCHLAAFSVSCSQ